MKKNLTAMLLLGFICLLGFVLTKITYEPVDSLIRPPKIEGENSEIQTAFEKSVESGYLLKSPLAGEYRSSFIRKDIDSDSSDEVIVFYSKTDAIDVIRINILDKVNGNWESIADIESTYNDIYQINFADIDNDTVNDLIVCWRNFENDLLNTLNIYKLSEKNGENKIESIFSRNYSEFLVCDVNSDGKTDILIFDKTTSNGSSEIKGTFFDFSAEEAIALSELTLDPAISSIGSVCYDYSSEHLRVYVDGYKTDTGITTDILYWNEFDNCLARIGNSDFPSITTVATRNKNIYSCDINGDSAIEIPVEAYIPFSEVHTDNSDEIKEQNYIIWMQHDGYGLNKVQYEIFNSEYGYSMKIPADLFENFTLKNNLSTGLMTFYNIYYEEAGEGKKPKKKDEKKKEHEKNNEAVYKESAEKLFSILATSEQNYDIYEFDGYRLIATDNGFDYYYKIFQSGKDCGITKETIKSMLST